MARSRQALAFVVGLLALGCSASSDGGGTTSPPAVAHGASVWVRPGGVTMAFLASSVTLLVVTKKP